ncbi:hypothetical protein [Actinoplanes sp. NPDC051494]|uniref:hypothetical protein n=1 Tax=Actinoplanes sp. NPDC051494 TaxID=3363907 RepID=UPI00378D4206
MTPRPVFASVTLVLALVLTGCSSSPTTAGPAPADAPAAAAPIPADELCAYLEKEAPRIKEPGTEIGVMAQLTTSIADLYGDHLDQLDGDVIDAQARETCPDIRAELTAAAGVTSFGDL